MDARGEHVGPQLRQAFLGRIEQCLARRLGGGGSVQCFRHDRRIAVVDD